MEIFISLIGLLLSFFFAGSETAYISTNQIRMEIWVRNKIKSALKAKPYFDNPDLFLSTTLVGNNLANVLTTSYATIYLITFWGETATWAVITFVVLLIGEIIPKILFRTFAHSLILKVMFIIRIFHFLLLPLIAIAVRLSSMALKAMRIKKSSEKIIFDKNDIVVLLNEARISGVVDEDEQKIISRVLNLPVTFVREAMIPRTNIHALEEKFTITELRKLIYDTGKTKIPIYKSTIDNIIGVVFMYDLFEDNTDKTNLIKPVTYVPENKKCNELLKELKEASASIAIVIDEYGGTAGIITIEDLVEELLGEIEESTERSVESIIRINKTTWKIRASEAIGLINEQIGLNLPDGDYETIGGFILTELGRIPDAGEKIAIENGTLMVSRSTKSKIEEVRIVLKST